MTDRGLRLADDEREAVDPQHEVVAALLGARVVGDLGRDDQAVVARVVEVDEPDFGYASLGADEVDRLVAAQPAHHPLVRRDQAVVRDGEDDGTQLRQDLVDPLRLRRDRRVQADERGDHLGLDEDRVDQCDRAAVPGTYRQPRSGLRQPIDERGLDGPRSAMSLTPTVEQRS